MSLVNQLSELLSEKTCIVGMGNYYRNDDVAGLKIVDSLKNRITAKHIKIMNVEDVLESYVFPIAGQDCKNVLIIDAVNVNSAPGSILFAGMDELDELNNSFSSHKISLEAAGRIFKEYGKKTYLLGIAVENIDFGTGISAEVRKSISLLSDLLFLIISEPAGCLNLTTGPFSDISSNVKNGSCSDIGLKQ
jgi:hydrogenase maturation protease